MLNCFKGEIDLSQYWSNPPSVEGTIYFEVNTHNTRSNAMLITTA